MFIIWCLLLVLLPCAMIGYDRARAAQERARATPEE